LEATVECREANDVKKREKEMSFVSDTVERKAEEKFDDCRRMNDKSEAKKCENDEILMRKVSESIDEVKNDDYTQKNERKTKRNDEELDDYDEEAKICDDEGHEGNKRMNLDNEMTDFNDSFLDSRL